MEVLKTAALLLLTLALCRAQEFAMHAFHAAKLGRLDCNLCHTAAAKGSVELKPPGPAQCRLCHPDKSYLVPAKRLGSVVVNFPHAAHVDPKARVDARTGQRADCTFCHRFTTLGNPIPPTHTQCATCHSHAGAKAELTPFLRTAGCRGCHHPEETERPHLASAGIWENIRFSHASHVPESCTTCHNTQASLPNMVDCASCHASSRKIAVTYRIANCSGCHLDAKTTNLSASVKPSFHTDAFRHDHAALAAAPDAKCFACHQNTVPSSSPKAQCDSCHLIMKPVSHTARWRDDIHGKYAALDRQNCATCHAADYCIRCHNELPASHVPLPLFKNGGHANLALLNERSCLTCHTYQNTCASCHTHALQKPAMRR
jgi:hypothetical protein